MRPQTMQPARTFSAAMAAKLRETGDTASRLARDVGVSRKTMSYWLSAKSYPHKRHWGRLQLILGVDRIQMGAWSDTHDEHRGRA